MPEARLVYTWSGPGKGKLEYITHNGISIHPTNTCVGDESLVISYTVPNALVHVVGALLAFHGGVLRNLELRLALDGREKVIAQSDQQENWWRARGMWTSEVR